MSLWSMLVKSSQFLSRCNKCSSYQNTFSTQTILSASTSQVITPRQRNAEKIEVIDINDESLGLISRSSARRLAEERHLKLVEVISRGDKSEYKLMDGKQLMLEQKSIRMIKKNKKPKELKTLRLASNIASNDLNIKSRSLKEWLEKGNPVKIAVKRKRSETPGLADNVMNCLIKRTEEIAKFGSIKSSDFEVSAVLKPNSTPANTSNKTESEDGEFVELKVINARTPRRF